MNIRKKYIIKTTNIKLINNTCGKSYTPTCFDIYVYIYDKTYSYTSVTIISV